MPQVLVTGGSGFIAGHCILQLLAAGHRVRTTVRSLARESSVRAVLTEAGMADGDALSFAAADLMHDAGWAEAVAGCDYVLHVASPVHLGPVRHDDEVVVPAREGALRVLRAARDARVKRVVLTSAFHAVGYGHPRSGHTFTEDDWSMLDGPGMDAYGRSKTLAERAAWDFVATEGRGLELATILPVAVMGPVMGDEITGANHFIQRSLAGALPGYANLYLPIVDVRDVAAAHLLAMETPGAAGRRFLISNGPALPLAHIGAVLRKNLGDAAAKVPARVLPDIMVRLVSVFAREFRSIVPDLGNAKQTSNARARSILGWQPRPAEEAIVAAASSIVQKGLVSR
ncbi:SDR family oxidoreductase [Catenuloplanes japonicus]|uniref:SDR family oxidoreductase n=1 Tax=Catenuloplanes japonicus TaxID=33876 RepID=UPI000526196B|nr:aldehyde reductase [Catenuloplanes japonicus]